MRGEWLRRTALTLLAAVLLAVPAPLLGVGGVYTTTKHGNPTTGVSRDTNRGDCAQCHTGHAGNAYALFAPNDNPLCYTCHSAPGAAGIYQGQTTYEASTHRSSSSMVWPGADSTVDAAAPRARMSADWGKCINCHDPHGYNADGTGLIPSLAFSREEKLCYVCHDGSPARTNVKLDFSKTYHHPVVNTDPLRRSGSWTGFDGVTRTRRTVECDDCHNPHAAQGPVHTYSLTATATRNQIASPGNPAAPLNKVSGVQFNWTGLANWGVPNAGTYAAIPSSTGATYEYEICLKCHSSYFWGTGTPPNGISPNGVPNPVETDAAQEFNPGNASYHPVVATLNSGTGNGTQKALQADQLKAPWQSNRGNQTMMCSDCHNTDAASPAAQGPHGSAVAFMLRGPNTSWPPTDRFDGARRLPTVYATTFCANCHTYTTNNKAHAEHDNRALYCYSCHIVIPHGGKLGRLIGDGDGTMPARYAFNNNKATMYVTGFTKNSYSNYQESNCGASCATDKHRITNGAQW